MNDTNVRTRNRRTLEPEAVNCTQERKRKRQNVNIQKQRYSQCGPSTKLVTNMLNRNTK